jgi:hypothetical protein
VGYGTVLTATFLTTGAAARLSAIGAGGVCASGFGSPVCRVRAVEHTSVYHKAYNVFSCVYTKISEGLSCVTSSKSIGYDHMTPPPQQNLRASSGGYMPPSKHKKTQSLSLFFLVTPVVQGEWDGVANCVSAILLAAGRAA